MEVRCAKGSERAGGCAASPESLLQFLIRCGDVGEVSHRGNSLQVVAGRLSSATRGQPELVERLPVGGREGERGQALDDADEGGGAGRG